MPHWDYDSLRDHYGTFLLPSDETIAELVYIQTRDLGIRVPLSVGKFTAPFRGGELVAVGKRHRPSGTLVGYLLTRNENGTPGNGIDMRDWVDRFYKLIGHWADGDISVALDSKFYAADEIAITGDVDMAFVKPGIWSVNLPWMEV